MTHGTSNEELWRGLMIAAQAGERSAYEQLLREIVPFIRALALRQNSGPDWAEDAVQDVLLTVHRVRHTYDPKRPFKPWLAAITQRRCVDLYRRRRRIAANETSDSQAYETFADPAANKKIEESHAAGGLREAIANLPNGQREAVELLKMKEMSLAEASSVSGRPIGALKVNVHRAIKTLRMRLIGDESGGRPR